MSELNRIFLIYFNMTRGSITFNLTDVLFFIHFSRGWFGVNRRISASSWATTDAASWNPIYLYMNMSNEKGKKEEKKFFSCPSLSKNVLHSREHDILCTYLSQYKSDCIRRLPITCMEKMWKGISREIHESFRAVKSKINSLRPPPLLSYCWID